jgi:protein-disulfide isomerase
MTAKPRIDADLQRGRSAGITSTPTIFINNVPVPYERLNIAGLKSLVDAELEKFSPTAK